MADPYIVGSVEVFDMPISSEDENGDPYTISAVEAAFIPVGTALDQDADFVAATLVTVGAQVYCRVTLGDDVVLTPGRYDCYSRSTATPQMPVLHHGTLVAV